MNSEINPAIEKPCYFHNWYFDPADGQLRSKQKNIRLQPRLSRLLAIFLANTDKLLTREQLIAILWQDKSVNEDALSRCIAELRSILGDNRNTPIYIKTIPKKGYRFLQPLKIAKDKKIVIGCIALFLIIIAVLYIKNPVVEKNSISTIQTALLTSKRLTTNDAYEYQPEISSIGDKVAFSVAKDNRMIIKVIKIDGSHLYSIQDPEYHLYSATFSPDDQFILVAGMKNRQCSIFIYQIPSLEKTNIGNCFMPNIAGIFDWSYDGKKIAYVSSTDNTANTSIWLYDFNTKEHTQITPLATPDAFDSRPRFSPDGKQIVYTRGTHSTRELFLINVDNPEKEHQLTNGKYFISSFSWLKDNKHIIFDSDELGERNLWVLNIENKTKTLLGARDAQFPSVNQDNSVLTYNEVRYNANIWNVDLNEHSAKPNKIIGSIKYNNHPAFSPDGQQIAFSSNRQGRIEIWLYSLLTEQQTKLLAIPGLNLFMPRWSEDGKRLIISSRGKNGYRCYEVDATNGEYHPLMLIKEPHYSCEYANNGDIYAVSRIPEHPSNLIKLSPDGTVRNLVEDSVSRLEKSGIGTIVYSLKNKQGLYSIDLDGNNKKLVLEHFNNSLDEHWTVQGHYVYFPKLDNQKGIWRIDLRNDKEEFVTSNLPSAIGLTMSVNFDHSRLLISRTDNRQVDIYVSTID